MNQNMPLNDRQRMEDLLTQEKYMISAYSTFLPEAGCPELRTVLTDNMNQSLQSQFQVYEKMNSLGWYPVKDAVAQDVQMARDKFTQMKQQLAL